MTLNDFRSAWSFNYHLNFIVFIYLRVNNNACRCRHEVCEIGSLCEEPIIVIKETISLIPTMRTYIFLY